MFGNRNLPVQAFEATQMEAQLTVGTGKKKGTDTEIVLTKFSLKFQNSAQLESEYNEQQFNSTLKVRRMFFFSVLPFFVAAAIIGILILDTKILDTILTLIVSVVVTSTACFGLTFLKWCNRTILDCISTFHICSMVTVILVWNALEFESLQQVYCVGSLLLIEMAYSNFLELSFIHNAVATTLLFFAYVIVGALMPSTDDTAFGILVIFIGSCSVMIVSYTTEFVRRQKFLLSKKQGKDIKRLTKETIKLKNELSKREQEQVEEKKTLNMDSPMEKVLEKLAKLRLKPGFTPEEMQDIQFISETLATHRDIWAPDIASQVTEGKVELDQETRQWLFYEVAKLPIRPGTPMKEHLAESSEKRLARLRTTSSAALFPVSANKQNTLTELLRKDKEWCFDIFAFSELTNAHALYYAAKFVFKKHNLIEKFRLDHLRLQQFFDLIDSGYHGTNPYHNNIHAADVVMNAHWLIVKGGLINFLTDSDIFTLLLAAVVHDYDHPGLNNAFQINTESKLALRYNNRSVLENHHCAKSFSLLLMDSHNFLAHFSQEERNKVRSGVIELVLATDMSHHFDILSHFKTKVVTGTFDRNNPEDRLLLLKMAIKIADLGNCAKGEGLQFQWCERITEEFFLQGDRERELGLPVSPFMDRKKPMIAKSQISFINYIVLPLIEAFAAFLGNEDFDLLKHLKNNYDQWLGREIEESRLRDLEPISPSPSEGENQTLVTSTEELPSAGISSPGTPNTSDIKSLLEEPDWKPRKLKLKPIDSEQNSRASTPESVTDITRSKRILDLKDDL